jgi:hypothetical protein
MPLAAIAKLRACSPVPVITAETSERAIRPRARNGRGQHAVGLILDPSVAVPRLGYSQGAGPSVRS